MDKQFWLELEFLLRSISQGVDGSKNAFNADNLEYDCCNTIAKGWRLINAEYRNNEKMERWKWYFKNGHYDESTSGKDDLNDFMNDIKSLREQSRGSDLD